MEQLFVFTAGNPSARAHLDDSIRSPIDIDRIIGHFDSTDAKARIRQIHEAGGLYAWGAVTGVQNIPRWETMEEGDWVLCVYANTYHFVARVVAKL